MPLTKILLVAYKVITMLNQLPFKINKSAFLLLAFGISLTVGLFPVIGANTVKAAEYELLTSPWHLTGNNGAAEEYQSISSQTVQNGQILRLTYNLHGLCALDGDASAIIFDQNGWKYVSLSKYGKNCLDGQQTVDIPLAAFAGLNLSNAIGTFHSRFWGPGSFTVDITSAKIINSQVTTNPTPTITPTSADQSGYSAQYFNNQTLSGSPTLTRTDNTINFDWGGGSPTSSIPVDRFSARWTRTVNLSGNYQFTVTADDGVRLYVDNNLVLDKWINQPATTYRVTQNLSAGNHTIKMEYFENSGGAVAKMSFATTTTTPTPTVTPTPAPTGNGTWSIQSVDSMKETKDKICGQDNQDFINRWVDSAKALGVNYVTVDTPYDNPGCGNSVAYAKAWIDTIRSRGLKVWHRHMPLAFEGIYNTPKATSSDKYLGMIQNYIKNNPNLFQEGDIFTPIPEPQNGGASGINGCGSGVCQYNSPAEFNAWLRDAIDISNNAFASIGLGGKIKIGYYGFDGYVAWGHRNPDHRGGFLEEATIQKMGNIAIDHYPELVGTSMDADLKDLQSIAKFQNVPIIISEWGSAGSGDLKQQVQNSMGAAAANSGVIGFNYWHMGMGGNEALINGDFSQRPQYLDVQSFYKGTR